MASPRCAIGSAWQPMHQQLEKTAPKRIFRIFATTHKICLHSINWRIDQARSTYQKSLIPRVNWNEGMLTTFEVFQRKPFHHLVQIVLPQLLVIHESIPVMNFSPLCCRFQRSSRAGSVGGRRRRSLLPVQCRCRAECQSVGAPCSAASAGKGERQLERHEQRGKETPIK